MNEADTCRKFVVPRLQAAGWDTEPHRLNEQVTFTDGRIVVAGRKARRRPEHASEASQTRMTAFWGDDSWRRAAYRQQTTLFGDEEDVKLGNKQVVDAFRERLKSLVGFKDVPEPMPMRNAKNAVVYYLFFASHKPVASKIVQHQFSFR